MASITPIISLKDVTLSYDDYEVMRDVSFDVNAGDVFVIMGGSGCGKSTLLKHMIGLLKPIKGTFTYWGQDFFASDSDEQKAMQRRFGVLYQGGALWSSLTLVENVALPLEELTLFSKSEVAALAEYKLALVGLAGFENFYPAQLSGGMRKRAALARAMALDPEVLFFDEPSAGLDPVTSRRLDELILELKEGLGTTIILVTHELESIFNIATQSIFLDAGTKSLIASGPPKDLLAHSKDPRVQNFLNRNIVT